MFTRNDWLGILGIILAIAGIGISILTFFFGNNEIPESKHALILVISIILSILITWAIILLIQRRKFLLGKPIVLIPLKANMHEIELWTKHSNNHFDVESLQISEDRYHNLYKASPNSFRVFKSYATGEVIGGYLFLFLNKDSANKVLRGELFMIDITADMLVEPAKSYAVHVCDIVTERDNSKINNVIMFDVFSQLIGTLKALDNIKFATAHSIDSYYEDLLKQMSFSNKPLKIVERNGRKLWIADSNNLKTISWSTNQHF